MSAPTTAEQLLALVGKSGLLDPPRLEEFARRQQQRRRAAASAADLADALVHEGLLTRFQADQLLAGRYRHFVLSGKYKILRPLGAGGMGQVFLCEHSLMRRRVAVKLLPPGQAGDAGAVERFHREVRALAQLHHPNIVTAHDADRDGTRHFLVMEYIDGPNLHQLVKERGPLPWAQAADYVRQAALGLAHAHGHGLVHRDVKPANLLVDRAGTVKVLDLGLARFFHDEADDLSRRHGQSPLGTTDYVAPEQALDSHAAGAGADVYSLGATFYYLLTGQPPFPGGTAVEKLIWHQTRQPPPLGDVRPDAPAGMGAVVERMMAKDPARRPPAAEVAEALAPWAQPGTPPPPDESAEPTTPRVLPTTPRVLPPPLPPAATPTLRGAVVPTAAALRKAVSPPARGRLGGRALALWLAAALAVAGTVGLAVYRQAWRGGAGDDRPAPRGAADGAAARLVYPDLDEETTAWEVYEEGKPKWSRGAVVDPEGSGRVLRCSLTGGVPYSSAHFYRNLPPRPDAGPIRLVLTLSFRFPPTTLNNQNKPPIIQALEFTTSEWRSGRRYELALQWLNVGPSAPCWRYWDARGPDHWRELKIPAPLEGDRWHALRLEGTFREERVVYDHFVIDGRRHELGITAPPAEEPGTPDKLAVGFQLNGNARQDPYHLDLDRVYLAIDRD